MQQSSVTDPAQRVDIVHQMQSILYRDQPYLVLWNDALLEAYSADWTGFKPQPDPDGDVLATYGPLSFISIHPVSGTSAGGGGSSSGISAGVWFAHPGGGHHHRRRVLDRPSTARVGRGRGVTTSQTGSRRTNEG